MEKSDFLFEVDLLLSSLLEQNVAFDRCRRLRKVLEDIFDLDEETALICYGVVYKEVYEL